MRITQGFPYEGKLSDARLTDEVGAPSSLCLSRQTVHPAEAVDAEEGGDAFEDLVGIEQHHHDEACQRKAARYDSGITIAQNEIRSSTSANLVSPPPRRIPAFVGI